MFLFFFKLPHSFDVSHCFIIIIWDESGITDESQSSVFISVTATGERSRMRFYSTFFSGILLPTLYIWMLSVFLFVVGAPFLKALPTCLYVGAWRRLSVALSLTSVAASASFCENWQYLLTGRGYLGLRTLTPPLPKRTNQSTTTDKLSFIRDVRLYVCVSKNQYLVSDIYSAEPHGHFPATGDVFRCSSSDATLWFFYKSYKMQRCWPFEGETPRFFYMVGFVWRKKKKLVLYTNLL